MTNPVRAKQQIRMSDSPSLETPDSRLAALRRRAMLRPLTFSLGALILVSSIFLLVPNLDFATSRFFYDPLSGFVGKTGWFEVLRQAGRIAEWCLAIGVIAPLLLKILVPQSEILLQPRSSLFVLASLAIGPGLIVNAILKDHWGRARPRNILEFGGDATYSAVWRITDQCERNCSFVSGEAASAFWLLTIVFLVPKDRRPSVAAITLAFAAAVSFTRLAAGAHFLSDILIAWLITLCVMLVLYGLVMQQLPRAFDDTVEGTAGRYGEALRRLLTGTDTPSQT
jgi:membrane-associated PAP2 superfamily phosphatase